VPVRPLCYFLCHSSSDRPRCRGLLPLPEQPSTATQPFLPSPASRRLPPAPRDHAAISSSTTVGRNPCRRAVRAPWPCSRVVAAGHLACWACPVQFTWAAQSSTARPREDLGRVATFSFSISEINSNLLHECLLILILLNIVEISKNSHKIL
jgi:hypothetical protein